MKSLLILCLIPISIFSQLDFIEKIDSAYLFAKKGIFWALENINFKKEKLENQLLSDNLLVASVKIKKMVDGFQIESTGYFDSYTAKVCLFRSSEYLFNNGYLKKDSLVTKNINTRKRKKS